MFSMPTLIEELKRVLFVKYEFQCREKLNTKCLFSEFSNYQNTDAKKKNNDFLVEYSSTTAVFLIVIMMEKIKLNVAENSKFEFPAKSI